MDKMFIRNISPKIINISCTRKLHHYPARGSATLPMKRMEYVDDSLMIWMKGMSKKHTMKLVVLLLFIAVFHICFEVNKADGKKGQSEKQKHHKSKD